ncbi:hypothetical protein GCK72_004682 [Caenorhabditis remanei]|uniref:Uncharacterized protein n=1 Tax=Caenorhabditis remanei TaxID=31234 RepID=A0A6A5HEM4_CAERE|nr:hypothetical protein GCK72_004682 [Caenorhabditis remanei]KAF1764732.1 hypothetical protein GCK72_004682 [Caenorhabditis remanei]
MINKRINWLKTSLRGSVFNFSCTKGPSEAFQAISICLPSPLFSDLFSDPSSASSVVVVVAASAHLWAELSTNPERLLLHYSDGSVVVAAVASVAYPRQQTTVEDHYYGSRYQPIGSVVVAADCRRRAVLKGAELVGHILGFVHKKEVLQMTLVLVHFGHKIVEADHKIQVQGVPEALDSADSEDSIVLEVCRLQALSTVLLVVLVVAVAALNGIPEAVSVDSALTTSHPSSVVPKMI